MWKQSLSSKVFDPELETFQISSIILKSGFWIQNLDNRGTCDNFSKVKITFHQKKSTENNFKIASLIRKVEYKLQTISTKIYEAGKG